MTYDQMVRAQIKSVLAFAKKREAEHAKDPEKARRLLVRIGILDKSGKRLARKYR